MNMKSNTALKLATLLSFVFMATRFLYSASPAFDTNKIEQLSGLKGSYNEQEGVFKLTSPRNDVETKVDGFEMPPFMGLTSWIGFQKGTKSELMAMGDLVLMQDEVNPVMSALLDHGFQVTALHNHFFYDDPKIFFMHIAAEGSTENLASGAQKAFSVIKQIRSQQPSPATSFGGKPLDGKSSITSESLEDIFGLKGQSKDGMFKVVIGRKATMPCGCESGKEMGVNTWAAFAGSDDNAIVDGDFCVLESELQAVLKSLRASNINIVAIHHHMTGENPRYIFLHYWGKGRAQDLAKEVMKAIKLSSS